MGKQHNRDMSKTDFREDGKCEKGCGRKATFAINFGEETEHTWFGYCGKCHKNEGSRVRINEIQ